MIGGYEKVILARRDNCKLCRLILWNIPPVIARTDRRRTHVFTIQEQGGSNETLRFELDETGDVLRMWLRNEYAFKYRQD